MVFTLTYQWVIQKKKKLGSGVIPEHSDKNLLGVWETPEFSGQISRRG